MHELRINDISGQIVDAAMKVHSKLGPGLLESAYETCLARELQLRGLVVQSQVSVSIEYEGIQIDVGYRIDLLVSSAVIVELKAIGTLLPLRHLCVLRVLCGDLLTH